MTDHPRIKRLGLVLILGLVWLFVTGSLVGRDPADPPGFDVAPVNVAPQNPCGYLGALLAYELVSTLGGSSPLVPLALGFVVYLTASGNWNPRRGLRVLAGFVLLVVVASTALDRWNPPFGAHPLAGPGGYLGASIRRALEWELGAVGVQIFLLSSLIISFIFIFEQVPFHFILNNRLFHRPGRVSAAPSAALDLVRPADAGAAAAAVIADRPEIVDADGRRHPGAPRLTPWKRGDERRVDPAANDPLSREPAARDFVHQPSQAGEPKRPHAMLPAPIVAASGGEFQLPPRTLLEPPAEHPVHERETKIQARAAILERTLLDFGYQVRVVQIDTGPVITQFEVELEAGLRVSRIIGLADDLAIALAVQSVRVVAPIPGKTTVGIEVPNDVRAIVRLSEVVSAGETRLDRCRIPLFLGMDVKGTPLVFDLVDMPHLLIAGRTGTGKSVCLNAMILSILMTKRPDEVKLLLIDPKMVELSQFKRIPHLMHPVVTDMKKAESILSWACDKMDERYAFLARAGVRNIQSYNELGPEELYERIRPEDENERAAIPTYMPYIVILADEMADLMMTAAKEVESHIVRLAQKSRAVGMHLIVATQKPTVDVVTGLIKGNLPARIAFQVASRGDSRVVLDEMGADRLLGNGDMLFLIPGTSHIIRAQGTYVSDGEVNRICTYLQQYPVEFSKELVQLQVSGGPGGKERGAALKERDEYYEPAIEIVIREGRGSCSLLQRALGIGYGRAARLIDYMAEDGIVGEYKAGAPREVLYTWDEWETIKNGERSVESVGS